MFSIQGIIGHSKSIKDIIHIIEKSRQPATVLILGKAERARN